MGEVSTQKLRILYLKKILEELTDEEHSLSRNQIIELLRERELNVERKALYNDIETLSEFGMDIIGKQEGLYSIGSRTFEMPEIKLLIDAVQSSKFITKKKSMELISKIKTLISKYDAEALNGQIFINERPKTENEQIYYNVDKIQSAIKKRRQIRFKYFAWNEKMERVLKHNGKDYTVSPLTLTWDDENYYLIAYDGYEKKRKHYRVDKMLNIEQTDLPLEQTDDGHFDLGDYTKKVFGMFGGDEKQVTVEAENSMAGVFIDRFGRELTMYPISETHFATSFKVVVSNQFLSWIIAMGPSVKITKPKDVVEEMRKIANVLKEQYL